MVTTLTITMQMLHLYEVVKLAEIPTRDTVTYLNSVFLKVSMPECFDIEFDSSYT